MQRARLRAGDLGPRCHATASRERGDGSRLTSEQGHRVRPRGVDCRAEDRELATAYHQHVTVVVLIVGVPERPGQHVRIVRAAGLHDGDATVRRREDLDPAVIADDPVRANEDCPSGADRDAGVLRDESDDLIELVVAEAVPRITKCGVDSEKRLTVGPQPANMRPRLAHYSSITAPRYRLPRNVLSCRRAGQGDREL